MLKVYRVGVATQRYQFFESDKLEFRETFWKIHCEELGNLWKPPPVYVFNPKKKEGHFVGFLGGRVFAVTQETMKSFGKLQTFFEQSGELLPFTHKSRQFFAFNCTNCLNALDEDKTVYSSGRASIDRYAFLPTRFHFSLLTVPDSRELLAVEGLSAREDEFKGYVEKGKLTGLLFEEVWKGEDPSEDADDDDESWEVEGSSQP
jgi:hypothetical protein